MTLLAAYKRFDSYLDEVGITCPVVLLSDGHSSQFNLDILTFLKGKNIHLFIMLPDTTGVTQLLDQINQKLHQKYRQPKEEIFTASMAINRKGFMTILAKLWPVCVPRDTIAAARKRVGVSNSWLDVSWMQEYKFKRASACM